MGRNLVPWLAGCQASPWSGRNQLLGLESWTRAIELDYPNSCQPNRKMKGHGR